MKTPNRPDVCPICKENAKEAAKGGVDIYGKPSNWVLNLKSTGAETIFLTGWYCSIDENLRGFFGTVTGFILDGKREDYISHNCVYLILPGDEYREV